MPRCMCGSQRTIFGSPFSLSTFGFWDQTQVGQALQQMLLLAEPFIQRITSPFFHCFCYYYFKIYFYYFKLGMHVCVCVHASAGALSCLRHGSPESWSLSRECYSCPLPTPERKSLLWSLLLVSHFSLQVYQLCLSKQCTAQLYVSEPYRSRAVYLELTSFIEVTHVCSNSHLLPRICEGPQFTFPLPVDTQWFHIESTLTLLGHRSWVSVCSRHFCCCSRADQQPSIQILIFTDGLFVDKHYCPQGPVIVNRKLFYQDWGCGQLVWYVWEWGLRYDKAWQSVRFPAEPSHHSTLPSSPFSIYGETGYVCKGISRDLRFILNVLGGPDHELLRTEYKEKREKPS